MRKNFEMPAEDLEIILNASKPTPVLYLSGGARMGQNPQENANYAWATLGRKMGFDPMSVRPTGEGNRFFSAETIEHD